MFLSILPLTARGTNCNENFRPSDRLKPAAAGPYDSAELPFPKLNLPLDILAV